MVQPLKLILLQVMEVISSDQPAITLISLLVTVMISFHQLNQVLQANKNYVSTAQRNQIKGKLVINFNSIKQTELSLSYKIVAQ